MNRAFGDLLREQRLRASKSLQEVAAVIGVSIAYVSDVERGRRSPFKPDRIIRVAALLGCDAEMLLAAAEQARVETLPPPSTDFESIFQSFLQQFRALDARQQREVATLLAAESGARQIPFMFAGKKKQQSSSFRVEDRNATSARRPDQPRRRRSPRSVPHT
jgi:transcriptional regulator with XRE-family HTH domain